MRITSRNLQPALLLALIGLGPSCHDEQISLSTNNVELNENIIQGTISFTNVNPDILAIINDPSQSPAGDGQGLNYIQVRTNSTNVSPTLSNSSSFTVQIPPATRTSVDYEITNEAGEAGDGIIYKGDVYAYLDSWRDRYQFAALTANPLERTPAAPVTLDFNECASMLDIKWVTSDGDPYPVASAGIRAYHENSPGSGSYYWQASASIPAGDSQGYMLVRGDDARYRLDIKYTVGSDPYSNQISTQYTTYVDTAACDAIVEVIIVVPEGGGSGGTLGGIAGNVNMLGKDEHRISNLTLMQASSGPYDNYRYDTVNNTPSQGRFELENLVPSDVVSPARSYYVQGQMSFDLGDNYQFFQTPYERVSVPTSTTVELGDTFVMDPGYVQGDILLAGPVPGPQGSCLQDLYRSPDSNGDGIPDDHHLYSSSQIRASGSGYLATGATKSASGGYSRSMFAGGFDAAPSVLGIVGQYVMALGGLLQENTIWQVGTFYGRFLDTATPSDPASYQSSYVNIYDQSPARYQEIIPGQTVEVPIHHCFGQLNLAYSSSGASFYNPRLNASGSYIGDNFEGNAVDYRTSVSAYGTPTSYSQADSQGMVVMCLPQGTYNLTPYVTTINPNGTTSNTELRPIQQIEVGCREVKTITPELSLSLDETPVCTDATTLTLSGSAESQDVPAQSISSITATVNEGDAISVCSNCGVDPSFTAEIPIAECQNDILVRAEDAAGSYAEVTRTVTRDGDAPTLSGCADITVRADDTLGGAYVDYGVAGADNCNSNQSVACSIPSGSFFAAESETEVTCSATDACGNASSCTFTVTVGDTDEDGDGIDDENDLCPGTSESDTDAGIPSTGTLGPNRWADLDGDGVFENGQIPGGGNGPGFSFTMEQTAGCNCAQIIEKLGLGEGHSKHGCSNSALQDWTALVESGLLELSFLSTSAATPSFQQQ